MVIEAKKNFFGLITIKRELLPGNCYALEQGTITSTRRLLEVSSVDNSEVVVQETLNPESAAPQRRVMGSFVDNDINNAKLESSRLLGVKASIGWKPDKK